MSANTESLEENLVAQIKGILGPNFTGAIPKEKASNIEAILYENWETFTGDDEALAAYKLKRAEEYIWEPPCLKFTIERHGAMKFGSSRAELQEWTINMDTRTKECQESGYRQIYKQQSRWYAEPVAEEIAEIILSGDSDERIEWVNPKKVKVITRNFVPFGAKQTEQYRKKRLYEELDTRLSPHGWERWRHIYTKS